MNRYYLISSIFSAIFLIYLWAVWLPEYAGDPAYGTQRTVAIVVSIAMLAVMVMTALLAKTPVEDGPKGEDVEKGTTSKRAGRRKRLKVFDFMRDGI